MPPLLKTPETEKRLPCVLSKIDVVNMLCGMQIQGESQPPVRIAEQLAAQGYMSRQGDLQEQDFSWDREALLTQPIEALLAVYIMLKKLDRPLIERV